MWWWIALGILVVIAWAACVIYARILRRRRMHTWNDLHQRSALIASQLQHFKKLADTPYLPR